MSRVCHNSLRLQYARQLTHILYRPTVAHVVSWLRDVLHDQVGFYSLRLLVLLKNLVMIVKSFLKHLVPLCVSLDCER